MAIPNKQIGWSGRANLLWAISKQLDILNTQMCTGPCPTTTTTSTTVIPTTTTTTSSSTSTTTSTTTILITTTTTTTAADVIPNPLNWTNITDDTSNQTNTQTISGINTSITLRIESDYNSVGQFDIFVNGVGYDMSINIGNDGFHNQIVNNGDIIYFYRSSSGNVSETVTVKNSSDSNVVIDTFTITLTGGGA